MRRVLPAIDFSFPRIAGDVVRLRDLLRDALRLLNVAPQAAPRILNLACGRADETGVLLEVLRSGTGGGQYLGLDLRTAEIGEASRRWRPSNHALDAIEFRVADASLAHHWPAKTSFDFIFIRHQNYWDAPAVWDQIFRHALARLNPAGALIFTSYFEREHELAIAALQTQGAHLSLDLPHGQSRSLADAPGKSVDKRLAVMIPHCAAEHLAQPSILPM
jgi:hypothetical protein